MQNRFFALLSFSTVLGALPVLADQEPPGRTLFVSASVAYHRGNYDDAIAGYRNTVNAHHEVPFSKMMIARCYSLKGDVENGIVALAEAAEFEFPNATLLLNNEEFANLRPDPRFAGIVAKVRGNARPCVNRDRRRALDFWVGEWDVLSPAGAVLGVDRVSLSEDGCLIKENWTGVEGDTGESVTVYDRLTAYWRQIWMDPSGQDQDLYGEVIDGALALKQVTYNGGLKTITVTTYTPQGDGTVRQLGRRSVDDGDTWTDISDFTYRPRVQ